MMSDMMMSDMQKKEVVEVQDETLFEKELKDELAPMCMHCMLQNIITSGSSSRTDDK